MTTRQQVQHILNNLPDKTDNGECPPWIAFPDIPRWSIGWRMGPGEDFMDAYIAMLRAKSPKEKQAFYDKNPEPVDWEGFYKDFEEVLDR